MLALRSPEGKSWPLAPGFESLNLTLTSQQPDSVELLFDSTTYERIYREQLWVFVCVNKLARSLASLPLKVYEGESDGDHTYVPKSAPAKLLRRPYPYARTFSLIENAIGNLGIYGNATFVKFRGGNGNTPAELWPMPWRNVQVVKGYTRPIDAYIYWGPNGLRKVFSPDDVVHFSWFNPNPIEPWGISPLEPLATTLSLENAGQRYAMSSYGNAARPASFIQSARNLTKQQRAELRDEINQSYGGPENAFKVALLDNGLEWKPLGYTIREAQLVESRKISREEVCAAYDIPPPMVGILDNATFSNIDKQHWMLYMDTFAPWCDMIEDVLMAQLVDGEPAWDGYFIKMDLDAKLRGNYEDRSQSHVRMLQSGAATPNEIRKIEDRPPISDPAADAIYVPANLQAVSPQMRKIQDQQQQQQADQARAHMEALRQGQQQTPPSNGNNPNAQKPTPGQTPQRLNGAGTPSGR